MTLFLLVLGAVLGGFVNGLTGFGFALMASGLWLQVLPPTQVVPLVVACMLASNLQALPRVWRMIEPRRTLPLAFGGLFGVPIGVWLLPQVPLDLFKLGVAGLILINLAFVLALRGRLRLSPTYETLHPAAGFLGGVFGGLNGLSGVVMTIWSGLFGWTKREKRGVFQGYNLIVAIFVLAFFWWRGYLNAELGSLVIIAIPLTIACSFVGARIFERMGDKGFTALINALLALSAANLLLGVLTA